VEDIAKMSEKPSASALGISRGQLNALVPIGSFGDEALQQILNSMVIERKAAGTRLFAQGDRDPDTYFLIDGEVKLTASDQGERKVVAGTEAARYALANLKPRQYSATALTDISIARVNSEILDRLLSWDQVIRSQAPQGYEVKEFGRVENSAWMLHLMRNPLFAQLPVNNIEVLVSRMEEMPYKGGDIVVHQGDMGEYFYVIQSGRCLVSRKSALMADTVELAALGEGDSFGEEALLADTPRNATVSMISDGVLMGLTKTDFLQLLGKPVVQELDPKEASAMVKAGAALVDVRLETEFKEGGIKNAVNIPLYLLRLKAKTLPKSKPVVVFCDTGARSAAAAFVLRQNGIKAYVLKDGLSRYLHERRRSNSNG
jgi:CRP-like cAMP-binding protein